MRGDNDTNARADAKVDVSGGRKGKDAVRGGISLRIFAPAIIFTFIMLGTLGWFAWSSYQHLRIVETRHFRTVQLIGIITHLDEVLTMSARMGASTGDLIWEQRYEEFEPQLDFAIKELTELAPEEIMGRAAVQTDSANVLLVEMENNAFALVREGKLGGATRILDSGDYAYQKRAYSDGMKDFTEALQSHTDGQLRKHRHQILVAASFVAVSVSLVLLVWVGMLHKLRYVFQQKKAERTLLQSEKKYRKLIANIPEVVWTIEATGRVVFVSPNVEKVCGRSSKEICSGGEDYWFNMVHPDDVERVRRAFGLLFEDGIPLDLEYRIKHKNEKWKWLHDRSVAAYMRDSVRCADGLFVDITKRKEAEDGAGESQKGLAIAQRVAKVGSWERDLKSGEVVWSDESFRMLGLEPGEVEPNFEVFMSYVHPDDKKKVGSAVESAIADSPSRVEFRVIRADGVERIFEGQGELVRDSQGEPSRIFGICQDITERRRAQDEMMAERNKLQSVADTIQCGLSIRDLDYNLTYQNEYLANLFGGRIGDKCYHVFEKETEVCEGCPVAKVFADGKSHTSIRKVVMPSGEIGYWENVANAIRDAEGRIISFLEVSTNITDRMRTEEALRESEERYRTVVENAGETIAVIDCKGVFQFMNRTGAERIGGNPEDYIGKTMWEVFPKEIADRQAGSINAVIDSGRGTNFITPTELQGQMRWYNTTIEPLRNSRGDVSAALIIARDVDEIRRAEMELDAYGEKMTKAERLASLGTISATLAHELTQPLTVISLSLEDSLTELEGTGCCNSVIEGLRDSLSEVGNVTAIVERFRSFARKSSGGTVGNVDLKVVAERIVKLLGRSAEQGGIKLHTKGMDNLPSVYINEKELEQLFFALVQNSIQAAGGDGLHSLIVEGALKKEYIELRFEDDCGGVAEGDVDNIFDPFFTTKAAGEGTGLGLCIVQRVAERSGGSVRVDNRAGKGVTIVVTLGIGEEIIS